MEHIKIYKAKLIHVRKKDKYIIRGRLLKGRERFEALQRIRKR